MRRYFIYMKYDGAQYCGWQVQPNGRTVQGVVEDALELMIRRKTPVVGAGRTDTGVHARMMVAHFDAETLPCPIDIMPDRLNRVLPSSISIDRIIEVTPDAHARFSATERTYHYYVSLQKSPFACNYSYRLFSKPDFAAMNEACLTLFEYSDFTSFSKLHTDVKTNNCRIFSAQWTDEGEGMWMFSIRADRFLRNMVRAIVGTLLDIGRGKLSVDGFRQIIEARDRCRAGSSVPACGLFLADIKYPDSVFNDSRSERLSPDS